MSHSDGVLFNCLPNIPMTEGEAGLLDSLCRVGHGFGASVEEIIEQTEWGMVRPRDVRGRMHSLIRKGYVYCIAADADDENDLYVPCSVRGAALKVRVG